MLTPDFLGDAAAIDRVIAARPEVYNHNLETVPRLYRKVRGKAEYRRSLDLLIARQAARTGHGHQERPDARHRRDHRRIVRRARRPSRDRLRRAHARPVPGPDLEAHSRRAISAARRVRRDRGRGAMRFGFREVVAGPFVRSSYHAEEMVPGRS